MVLQALILLAGSDLDGFGTSRSTGSTSYIGPKIEAPNLLARSGLHSDTGSGLSSVSCGQSKSSTVFHGFPGRMFRWKYHMLLIREIV